MSKFGTLFFLAVTNPITTASQRATIPGRSISMVLMTALPNMTEASVPSVLPTERVRRLPLASTEMELLARNFETLSPLIPTVK
jgi:hypothetical protein